MRRIVWVFLFALALLAIAPAALGADPVGHTVSIRIGGVDVTNDVVYERSNFKGMADMQPGQANLVIDDKLHLYDTTDIHAGKTLELYIDGTREWDGWIFNVKRSWPMSADDTSTPDETPRFWVLQGYDRNILLHKRVMHRVDDPSDDSGFKIWPAETSDKVAIDYALANYVDLSGDGIDTTSGIETIASPGPYEEFTLGYVSAPLGVLFEDAAKITGGVTYIGPDRVLYYVDDMTVTAPSVLSDVRGAGKVNYRDFDAGLDFTKCANEALVWGAGKGSSDPVFAKYTDDDSVAAHGLWQWGDLYIGAWKQQTVNRRARTFVEGSPSHRRGHNDPVPVVTCSVFEPGFRVGQVATFESSVFGYSEALPIHSSTITFPTPTDPRWDLELTLKIDTPFGVPDLWKYPPFDISETIPPEGPGGIGTPVPPTGTSSGGMIDDFDSASSLQPCGGYDLPSATSKSVGTTHLINLPDAVVGQAIYLAVVETYPTDGFPIMDQLTALGFTSNNQRAITAASVDYQLTSWFKVLDGTESFFGQSSLTLTTPDTKSVMAFAIQANNLVGAHAGSYSYSLDPPSLDPSWSEGYATAWITVAMADATITGDPAGYGNAWDDSDGTVFARASVKNGNGVTDDPSAYGGSPTDQVAITVALQSTNQIPITGAPPEGKLCNGPTIVGVTSGKVLNASSATITLPVGCNVVGRSMIVWFVHDPATVPNDTDIRYYLPTDVDGEGQILNPGSYWYFIPGGSQVAFSDFKIAAAYSTVLGTEGYVGDGTDTVALGPFLSNINVSWGVVLLDDYVGEPPTVPPYGGGQWTGGSADNATKDPGLLPAPDTYGPWAAQGWDAGSPAAFFTAIGTNSSTVTGVPAGYKKIIDVRNSPENGLAVAVKYGPAVDEDPTTFFTSSTYAGTLVIGYTGKPSISEGWFDSDNWVTPPPSVTGADPAVQPGGNEYGSGTGDVDISDSYAWLNGWMDLYSDYYQCVGVNQGDWDDPARTTPVRPWGKTPLDLVVRFKRVSGVSAGSNGAISLEFWNNDLDPTAVAAWSSEQYVAVYWDDAGESYILAYPSYRGGVGIAGSTYPDGLGHDVTIGYLYYSGSESGDYARREWDDNDWQFEVKKSILEPEQDVDYVLRIQIGTDVIDEPSNLKSFRVKLWKDTDAEPSSWDIDIPMGTYRYGQSTYLGYPSEDGWYSADGMSNDMIEIDANPGASDEKVGIQGLWLYGAAPGVGSYPSDVPIYDSSSVDASSIYITRYPYAPGSLEVYFQGMRLRPNTDYVEVDPSSGQFRILDDRDISSELYVRYWRAGTTPNTTGGTVYRPAPQLQYGWGTPFDGYNCTFASSAMALDRHTLGANTRYVGFPKNTPPNHRGFQNDQAGGADLYDANLAWQNGWGKSYAQVGATSWSDFKNKINQGRGAVLQGIYGALPASKRFSDSFTGGHAIYINEQFSNGNFWGCDPLYRYPVIYTEAELKAYAEAIAGAGSCWAAFTGVAI